MKLFIVIITLLVILIIIGSASWSAPKKQVSTKYRLGLTVDEAKKYMSKDYETNMRAGGDSSEPSNTEIRSVIVVEDEHIRLYFNYYQKLIKVVPYSSEE